MLTWSYVFVLPVCTCLDYMKNPLLLLLPAWRPTWVSYFKSERGEDEMLTRPYLLLSLRFTGMSFHYIKTTACFACVHVLTTWRTFEFPWLHEDFSDHPTPSRIVMEVTWWPNHACYFPVLYRYLNLPWLPEPSSVLTWTYFATWRLESASNYNEAH